VLGEWKNTYGRRVVEICVEQRRHKGGFETVELSIKVGGAAGQGIQTIGAVLAKTFQRGGLYVFGVQHYYSRIRGGHNYFQMRISDEPVAAITEKVNMLIALDAASLKEHLKELEQGVVVMDREAVKVEEETGLIFHVPLSRIAVETGGSELYSNAVATGAAIGLLCYDFQLLAEVLSWMFSKKGEDVVKANTAAARAGYEYAQENYPGRCLYTLKPVENPEKRMLITGNEAMGLGAFAAGLKVLSAYPMTPSTGVMSYVAAHGDAYDVIVEQAEDEIAAINMALGAAFAGVRAMTTTSGGGFSLMVEALGLAGMTETPVVIFLCQRPGPATGLPTMTEQGDLLFALHAAQGEFPRCVLAPKNAEDAFYLTQRAFNIADRYQIPVLLLSDQYLADSLYTCSRFDPGRIRIERHVLSEVERREAGEGYRRYRLTGSGISPRALPGLSKALVVADSDEHDEEGHINESVENRVKMADKRMRKLEVLRSEIAMPEVYGADEPDLTLLGWGSTYGPLRESVDRLAKAGVRAALIHFTELYPLPHNLEKLFQGRETLACVENNYTGQFARLLRMETGIAPSHLILKYDGRPYTPEHVIRELRKRRILDGEHRGLR